MSRVLRHAIRRRLFEENTGIRSFADHQYFYRIEYHTVFEQQKAALVLVKGGPESRLLSNAYRFSEEGLDRSGKPLKILSRKMQGIFGDFGGHVSIQRSPPRWVEPKFVDRAIDFMNELE
jgi:hypothetical protein